MSYNPNNPPDSPDNLGEFLARELREIAKEFTAAKDFLVLRTHFVEPVTRTDWMIVAVDGVRWNPGCGRGLYRWDATLDTWCHIG